MQIIVDYREKRLYDALTDLRTNWGMPSVKLDTAPLKLGDVSLRDVDGVELVLIERKTIPDLISSIQDGRYGEQSYRLNHCSLNNHSIHYLIEGTVSKCDRKTKRMVLSAMVTLNHYKGFSVTKSSTPEESAEFILSFADKLQRKGPLPLQVPADPISDYVAVTDRTKKSKVTPQNIGSIMLSQIPGVSTSTACETMHKFRNLRSLITSLEKSDTDCLSDISISGKTGKKRKISRTAVQNIHRYLTH